MKKLIIPLFILSILLGGAPAYADECGNTPVDRVGDWLATLGKKDAEKQQILIKRKADRNLACAQKKLEKASQDAQKAAADMKKKIGF